MRPKQHNPVLNLVKHGSVKLLKAGDLAHMKPIKDKKLYGMTTRQEVANKDVLFKNSEFNSPLENSAKSRKFNINENPNNDSFDIQK